MNKEDTALYYKTEEAVSQYAVAANEEYLDMILKRFNVKEIFDHALKCDIYDEGTFFDQSFVKHYLLNVFEGCVYNGCNTTQIRAALLIAMFRNTGMLSVVDPFEGNDMANITSGNIMMKKIIDLVVEGTGNKALMISEKERTIVGACTMQLGTRYNPKMGKASLNENNGVMTILYDAYYMLPYQTKTKGALVLKDAYMKLYNDYVQANTYGAWKSSTNYDVFLEKLFTRLRGFVWQSRWARMKSFNNNWPANLAAIHTAMAPPKPYAQPKRKEKAIQA